MTLVHFSAMCSHNKFWIWVFIENCGCLTSFAGSLTQAYHSLALELLPWERTSLCGTHSFLFKQYEEI